MNKFPSTPIIINASNKKTYVRAYSKDGKINEAEELISKINESLN